MSVAVDPARLAADQEALRRDLLDAIPLSTWELLQRSAARFPKRPAVVDGTRSLTYAELTTRVLRCAARLHARGIGPGSRVALLFDARLEWAIVHYALARLGAVAVPLNLAYERDELAHVLRASRPQALIGLRRHRGRDLCHRLAQVDESLPEARSGDADFASLRLALWIDVGDDGAARGDDAYRALFGEVGDPLLPALGHTHGGDDACLIFTSGSTAAPKPALCAHRAYTGAATALGHALGLDESDRYLAANAVFHTGGVVWNLSMPHAAGAAAHLLSSTDPGDILRALERERITTFSGFDTKYTRLMADPAWERTDLSSVTKGNAGCTPSFMKVVEERWPYETLAQVYGSTESGGVGAITPFVVRDPVLRRESNGLPLPGMEFRIVDPESGAALAPDAPGEICFRGWGRFVEYAGMPEATAQAIDAEGFFHSGDLGWLDERGFLYFRGRFKQMIKTGGENVAEREVEIFLERELESVRCAQVVGIPHREWGEAIVAFVEQPRERALSPEALREACRGRIAGFKIPKHFVPVAPGRWPTLGSGRIDKHALRERAREALAAGVEPSVPQERAGA